MPNWCDNTLLIEGKGAWDFLKACRGTEPRYVSDGFNHKDQEFQERPFTFNALVPVPEGVLQAGYSNDEVDVDGYRWQIANWGTKWDITPDIHTQELPEEEAQEEVCLSFQSAWSPPIQWVAKVGAMYPHLTFTLEYFEPGMAYAGRCIVENGETEDFYYSYEDDETAYKEFVTNNLGWENFFDEDEEVKD